MDKTSHTSELIEKYIKGECTKEELEKVLPILENSHHDLNIRSILHQKWEEENKHCDKEDVNLTTVLNNIHHLINLEEGHWRNKDRGFRIIYRTFIRIAAILFVPLLIAGIWYYISSQSPYLGTDAWITINSPLGSRIKTTLPDSTVVWQNGGSTIQYPRDYTKRNRQVKMDGEAFFEVTSDKLHPFYVVSNDLRIKVTGTMFNVSSYPDDNYTSVVLAEGKVFVEKTGFSYELDSGNEFCFFKNTGRSTVKQVDVEKLTSWKDGKLIFRNDPLSEVAKRLSRWYNVEIELKDDTGALLNHPFTMTIEYETLPQVLNYLTKAAPLKYTLETIEREGENSLSRYKYIITPVKQTN